MNFKKAVFAGTFDPITYGHSEIIHRASRIFDEVIIAIGVNPNKKPLFSIDERIDMIKECTNDFGNHIEVKSFDGLLTHFCYDNNANVIIRGLRTVTDFDYEMQLAMINAEENASIYTMFLPALSGLSAISSSTVKELAKRDGNINKYVHPFVKNSLLKKLGKKDE